MSFRLPRGQERTWFVDQMTQHGAGYLIPLLLRMHGPLDADALRRALREIVTRHEVLRTSVVTVADRPAGVVRPPEAFALAETELSGSALRAAGGLEAVLLAETTAPLDLAGGLPLRARLLRLAPDDHVLCMTVHHMAFDDWSCGVLYRELGALYAAFSAGEPSPLPPLPLQYRDVAERLDALLAGEEPEKVARWRAALGEVAPFELRPDHPRPPRREGRGDTRAAFSLSPEIAGQLVALGRGHRATLVMVLLAACQAVLYRCSGRGDVTVGTTTAMRDRPETEGLIGLLVNMLPLPGDVSGNPTFAQLLERTRDLALDAYEGSDVPFDRLVEELAPERDLSRTPLFQILVNFGGAPRRPPSMPGLEVSELTAPSLGSKYDIGIDLNRDDDGLHCTVTWDTALYEPATIERLAGCLRALLLHVAARPDTPVDQVPLLTPDEQAELRALVAREPVDFPARCLHELFEEQAGRTPAAVALQNEARTLTYAALDDRANRIAWSLRDRGVGPDVPVGILIDRSPDMVAALLGVLKSGGAYLPVDTEAPDARVARLLGAARAPVCLVPPERASAVAAAGCTPLTVAELAAQEPPAGPPPSAVRPHHLCAVYYTSGSTGAPKGVACTHAGWVNRMSWMQRRHRLRAGEAVLHKTTLSFDDAAVEVLWPLLVGGRVSLLAPGLQRDPRAIADAAIGYGAVHVQFVPSVLELFLEVVGDDDLRGLRRLRSVLSSGEALRPSLARRFMERFGDRVTLDNTWGATEASIDSTCHTCGVEDGRGDGAVSLGRPIDNHEVCVLGPGLEPLPPGIAGELCIGGVGLARGYLHDPARTAEAFVPHPLRPGERLYRTGDRGRLRADGSLEFLDRLDHQVKIRGVRIELGEVEAALRACPEVADAAVTTWDAAPGDKRLAAYAVLAAGSTATGADLGDLLRERLPGYLVPSAIMVTRELPRLPSGKLDRRALPAPDPRGLRAGAYTAPRDSTERALAAIWSEVLGVPRLGVHDSFFAVGGHSLLVIRAVNRMRQAFATDVPLSLVFECPTVARAAARLNELILAEIQTMSDEEAQRLVAG